MNGIYRYLVTSPDARRAAFAAFVKRATDEALASRSWSVPRVAKEAGIGTNTLYRWLRGDWTESPAADLVEKFCVTLDIPTGAAFSILWPGKQAVRQPTAPLTSEPEFETLLRRLRDPNVSEAEKYLIRETIRSLAARRQQPTGAARKKAT